MRNKKIFWLFVVLSVFYTVVTLYSPTEESVLTRYSLTPLEATLLELTLVIPIVAIWFVSYYGWSKISRYADTLTGEKEGHAFKNIKNGLLFLVLWLPVNMNISTISQSLNANNDSLTGTLVVTGNYINLITLLIAMILLSKGAFELKSVEKRKQHWAHTNLSWIILAVIGFSYAYLTLSDPHRQIASDAGKAAYYLPDWLLASTIVFPYLVVFYLAFRTVQYIHTYKQSVKGIIYKDALKFIANGIALSVAAILSIRYLVSLNMFFEDAALKVILSILYLLVVVIAAGFLLIAKGARRLQKIEEI